MSKIQISTRCENTNAQSLNRGPAETRRGVTLIELLVVIAIMIAVMAVAIPVVRLTTNDNRVTLATQSVRSFLQSAALQADLHGRSYVIFERNTNVPDFCYRLYQGRPRPPYRGEDESAYAIMAPKERVLVPGVPNSPAPLPPGVDFDVFYLFNADVSKIHSYEYLGFRDRPEKYLVYQAFQMTLPGSYRPVVKVFCRLDPQQPMSPVDSVETRRSAYVPPLSPPSEFQQVVGVHANWIAAGAATPIRSTGGQANFWPADLVLYPPTGPANVADIPNLQSGQFTSRMLAFEISQPPMIDELNYLDLPQGMAIYLGASGFGDIDGFEFNGAFIDNFAAYRQFAFRYDMGIELGNFGAQPEVISQMNDEVQDPQFRYVKNEMSPIRAEYYPRIEFQAGGRISRAFGMSPRFTAAGSVVLGPNNLRIARQGPIDPLFPLYLLVGEDNVEERKNQVVLDSDYWIMLGAQTSTPKIVKAIRPVPFDLEVSRIHVPASVSER